MVRVRPGVTDLQTLHPDLAPLLVGDPTQVSAQSNKSYEWRCNKGLPHTYPRTAADQVNKSKGKCRTCNEVWFVRPDLYAELVEPNERLTIGGDTKVLWRCQRGHEYPKAPRQRVVLDHHCRECECISVTHPDHAARAIDDITGLKANSKKKIWWRCAKDPSHEYKQSVLEYCVQQSGCPVCRSLGVMYPHLAAELVDPADASRSYGDNKPAWWRCPSPACGKEYERVISERTLAHTGCKHCADAPRGFSTGKTGYLYLIRGSVTLDKFNAPKRKAEHGTTVDVVKFGITNNRKQRLATHRRQGLDEVVKVVTFANGLDCAQAERDLKALLKQRGVKTGKQQGLVLDGHTEMFVLGDPSADMLLKEIHRWMDGQ